MWPAVSMAVDWRSFVSQRCRGRSVLTVGLLLLASGLSGALHAQPAQPQESTNCMAKRPLGVSRVLEIDTTGGPRFGYQQYKDHDFLREGEVVLTFDDGPLRQNTKSVLDALAAHCTRATFFMVGKMAQSDPELVREVARRGHTVGTHTMSHSSMRTIGASRAEAEIETGINAVSKALGRPVAPFFRFPFLADSRAMIAHLGQRNIAIFSIDVDAVDYRAHTGSTVHRNVMLGLLPLRKGILLFHDIQPSTAQGLMSVLDDLAAKGYKVVHLVPKAPVVTLAGYDQKARATANAPGAVGNAAVATPAVNPAINPGFSAGGRRTFAPPGPAHAAGAAVPNLPASAAQPPVVVYQTPAAAPQPQGGSGPQVAAPQAPALRGTRSDDDWRLRVFNN